MKFGRVYGNSSTTSSIASRNLHVWMKRNKDFTEQSLHAAVTSRSSHFTEQSLHRAVTSRSSHFTQQSLHNTVHLHWKVLPSYAVINNQFITNCRSSSNCTHSTLNTQHCGPSWHFKNPTNSVQTASSHFVHWNTNRALSHNNIRS